ncbi:hypothetical protein ACWIGI_30165 [Nocardia sp. NPDC055321]
MRTPEALLADRGWRIRNSLWVLGVGALGCLNWACFLYIAVRTRHRAYWVAAFAYVAAAVITIVLIELQGPTEEEVAKGSPPPTATQETISSWMAGFVLAVWIGGIVHALLIRPRYLELLAQRQTGSQTSLTPAYPNPIAAQQYPSWMSDSTHAYWGPTPGGAEPAPLAAMPNPGAQTPAAAPDRWGQAPGHATDPRTQASFAAPDSRTRTPSTATNQWGQAPGAGTGSRVHVHTASLTELAGAGLSHQEAEAVLRARMKPGGIRNLVEFAAVTGVKPHRLHALADRLDLTHQAESPPPAKLLGRRLDL